MLEAWRHCEAPEVLSWRFNPADPFDRPWRVWTKSARAKETSKAQITQLRVLDYPISPIVSNVREFSAAWKAPSDRPTTPLASYDLDEEFKRLRLPFVNTDLNYLANLDLYSSERPYLSRLPHLKALQRSNMKTESHPCKVYDISGHEDLFNIEESGFEFAKSPIPMEEWTDSTVRAEYLPKVTEWLQERLKSSKVLIYAYNFRGQVPCQTENKASKAHFLRVHCDSTPGSCLKRLQLHLPDEAQKLMKSRVRFINVWRPILSPVQDCPLAFCDYRTVNQSDLVQADIIFPHYCDEAYEVRYNPDHRWVYKKEMASDDVLVFKLGDNLKGTSSYCPHSAFMDPSVPDGVPSRVSIEVRAIVLD